MHATAASAPANQTVKAVSLAAAALLVLLSFVNSPRPAATGPVATALQSASSSDRAKVASIYRALADVTRRDAGRLISTTALWRVIHGDALRLAAGGTDLVGKYKGLDVAVEEVLAKHFPLDNVAITPEVAEKISAGCTAVEVQCGR
jgi:hypothetical protein